MKKKYGDERSVEWIVDHADEIQDLIDNVNTDSELEEIELCCKSIRQEASCMDV